MPKVGVLSWVSVLFVALAWVSAHLPGLSGKKAASGSQNLALWHRTHTNNCCDEDSEYICQLSHALNPHVLLLAKKICWTGWGKCPPISHFDSSSNFISWDFWFFSFFWVFLRWPIPERCMPTKPNSSLAGPRPKSSLLRIMPVQFDLWVSLLSPALWDHVT